MSARDDQVRLHARRPILGAPISEHDTPRANADFESRAYREPILGRRGAWVVIALALCAAMLLAPIECYVRGIC